VPAPATCSHCGLALARPSANGPGYCCTGCEIAALLTRGARSSEAAPLLARLGLATFLSMNVMMVAFALWGATPASGPLPGWVSLLRWLSLLLSIPALALLLPPLAASGFARLSARTLRVELLVVAASLAAFAVSAANTIRERGEVWFDSATMVPLVVLIGSWLAARARSRARDDLERLFAAAPVVHRVRRGGGESPAAGVVAEVAEAELAVGDELELAAGARVPADGLVLTATSARLDGSLLTGEPLAREVVAGDRVRAGEVVRGGFLALRTEHVGSDSTLGRLRAALASALAHPPRALRAVDGAGRILVAATALLALLVVLLGAWRGAPLEGLHRALALLVVACPCSIGLAAPLTLSRALGAAARLGAVVRSLEGFEQLARVDVVAADKTGTLTSGDPSALAPSVEPIGAADAGAARALAVALAKGSTHPLAQALRAAGCDAPLPRLTSISDLPGKGVRARTADGGEARLGRRDFALAGGDDGAPRDGAEPRDAAVDGAELASLLTLDGRALARVGFRETPRAGVERLGEELRRRGIELVVLSGDADARARRLARELGGRGVGGLDPERKAEELAQMARGGRRVAWLFDGANDAVALASAPVSIAVDRKLEWLADAADVVLLGERVGALPQLIDLSRRARRRVVGALAWAALYHAVALTLGALGLLTPASAALVMAAGSLAVVKASLRPLALEPAPAPAADPGETPPLASPSAPSTAASLPRLEGATP
jgi:heavy metal translocating P-type ATPase